MTTAADWLHGARPRTLPAAIAPVLAGTAVAWWQGAFLPGRALLALVVALALQVGVNYSNDYSDGIRGTDDHRPATGGPVRLVGQRLATPRAVLVAALLSFALAAVSGLGLVVLSQQWWLLGVGAAAIAAAWFYTGGSRPYGYAGLGEVMVFLFFGVVAVAGTAYVQSERLTLLPLVVSVGVGAFACAILVANNLRDRAGDEIAGKRTLAVRLGDARTRTLYVWLIAIGIAAPVVVTVGAWWLDWPLLAGLAAAAAFAVRTPVRAVLAGAQGPALVPVLVATGRVLAISALLLAVGILLSRGL